MASVLQVPNETESSMSRITQDGRHLTYEVKVIQQPERARACGSGAKCEYHWSQPLGLCRLTCIAASADRRPVDPPPVCELKIYEGEGEAKNDVTFAYNANFFLFTTLENARPIAKGRGPAQTCTIPVLTGSPVAGMAYLDRPSPAGYFIFPDLSVRHEGLYRLSFSLFEELKETKDGDNEVEDSPKAKDELLSSNPMAPRAHVHFRLEVKSTPFAVYSAKKFPGLTESTPLSRTVAEQGCRVRIRRDVRMRRRDKPADGFHEYEDENAPYAHSVDYGTPHQEADRQRSISNASVDVSTPYSNGRCTSNHDASYFTQTYPQASYQPPPPPVPTQSATSYTSTSSHLNFGGSSTPQYATPQLPVQHNMHQVSQGFVQQGNVWPSTPGVHSRQASVSQNFYHQPVQQQLPYGQYTQPSFNENPDYRQAPDRRASAGIISNYQSIPPNMNSYVQNHHAFQQPYGTQQQQYSSRTATPVNNNTIVPPHLPPLRTDNLMSQSPLDQMKYEPKYEAKYETKSPMLRQIQPSPSTYQQPSFSAYPSTSVQAQNNIHGNIQKRGYNTVFDDSHLNQTMQNGMRPSSADHGKDRVQIETDDGGVEDMYDMDALKSKMLQYKRADGRTSHKKCPSPIDSSG